MNGVKINFKQTIGIALGFIGALLASNGQLITKYYDPTYEYYTKFQNYATNNPKIMTIFSLIFLTIMVFWAYAIVLTKKIKANTFQINYVLGIYLLLAGALAYPYAESKCTKLSLFLSIFFFGIPIVLAQWFFIASLTMTKNTGVLTMLGFTSILIGYIVSIFRYGEQPNFVSLLGVILLIIGMYKTIFNKEIVPS